MNATIEKSFCPPGKRERGTGREGEGEWGRERERKEKNEEWKGGEGRDEERRGGEEQETEPSLQSQMFQVNFFYEELFLYDFLGLCL